MRHYIIKHIPKDKTHVQYLVWLKKQGYEYVQYQYGYDLIDYNMDLSIFMIELSTAKECNHFKLVHGGDYVNEHDLQYEYEQEDGTLQTDFSKAYEYSNINGFGGFKATVRPADLRELKYKYKA